MRQDTTIEVYLPPSLVQRVLAVFRSSQEASGALRGYLGRHRHTVRDARLIFVFGLAEHEPGAFGLSDASATQAALAELGRIPIDFSAHDPRLAREIAEEMRKWLTRPLIDEIGKLA